MSRLTIRNIGPIKNVDIILNKVNVVIGPQSSGKSTVNKIACYCAWVEKKISLDQSFDYFEKEDVFYDNLVRFHKLEGYLKENSIIFYKSDILVIDYKYSEKKPSFTWINKASYQRAKLSYIPAERNIIAMISDWNQVSLPDNNIRNFMGDWNIARKLNSPASKTNIPSLNIKYYFDEEKEVDYVVNEDESKTTLINASSGIQSYVPLHILVDYFTSWIYNHSEPQSVVSQEKELNLFLRIRKEIQTAHNIKEEEFNDLILKGVSESGVSNLNKKELTITDDFVAKYARLVRNNSTKLYIEEPELNLFPNVQKQVLYYLINSINKRPEDTIFITTHSPYILYSLNNCIMGWLVKDTMPKSDAMSLESYQSWIDPKLVSIWQIKDGEFISIQEAHTKGVGQHYFNEVMNEIMNEYYNMLNYLDYQ